MRYRLSHTQSDCLELPDTADQIGERLPLERKLQVIGDCRCCLIDGWSVEQHISAESVEHLDINMRGCNSRLFLVKVLAASKRFSFSN